MVRQKARLKTIIMHAIRQSWPCPAGVPVLADDGGRNNDKEKRSLATTTEDLEAHSAETSAPAAPAAPAAPRPQQAPPRDGASNISMKALLEAGVHFGHQTKRWNPKMRPYIFT